jgi:hypothetical protein
MLILFINLITQGIIYTLKRIPNLQAEFTYLIHLPIANIRQIVLNLLNENNQEQQRDRDDHLCSLL